MARAVIAALSPEGIDMGRRGRRFAEREHGWTTVFDRLFTLYREVLHR